MSQTVAIVLAAGAGKRLGAQTGKALVTVGGKPMLAWSLEAFDRSPHVDRMVLAVPSSETSLCRQVVTSLRLAKAVALVEGGETRHQSEFKALESLAPQISDGSVSGVLVHDAARPFVDLPLLSHLLEGLATSPGVIPALPAEATLISGVSAGQLQDFVANAWSVQTPQAFRAGPLLDAHRRARADGFEGSDTASVLERIGQPIAVVEGNPDTFKITTPVDLVRAQLVARRHNPSPSEGA